jgi:uncharacterized membrane protein YedE/YeeE
MNAGFRNLLGRRDTSRFKAYVLAIAVQMLVLPLLDLAGIHPFESGGVQLTIPDFYPLGAPLGGFLFGLTMNWSGGCPAGVWYKLGGGSISAFVAIIGLMTGYSSTESGVLKPLRVFIQSVGNNSNIESMTLASLSNLPLLWITLPFSVALLFFLLKESPNPLKDGWNWRKTGLWIGVVGVVAWAASSLSGRFFGMAVLPGSKETLDLLSRGNWASANWDLFFVIGIPIGGYLAAARSGSFKWSNITGAAIWRLAAGGFMLGVSGSLAGGCTVGHGLAGIPLLSLGSITFTVFAIFGAWAGVIIERNKKKK